MATNEQVAERWLEWAARRERQARDMGRWEGPGAIAFAESAVLRQCAAELTEATPGDLPATGSLIGISEADLARTFGLDDATAPVRLHVPGLPGNCPSCRLPVTSWPLGTYGNRAGIVCPHCHVTVASVDLTAHQGLT